MECAEENVLDAQPPGRPNLEGPRPGMTTPPLIANIETPTSPVTSVLAADGTMYQIGEISSDDTIFSVKQRLATLSDMDEESQSIFLIDDTRDGEEDLELKNDDTVGVVMRLSSSSSVLRFAVLLGLKDDNAGDLVMGLSPRRVPAVTVGDATAGHGIEQLHDPRGCAFVPDHPHLLVATAYGSNQVGLVEFMSPSVSL
jgi:hypothetical protein